MNDERQPPPFHTSVSIVDRIEAGPDSVELEHAIRVYHALRAEAEVAKNAYREKAHWLWEFPRPEWQRDREEPCPKEYYAAFHADSAAFAQKRQMTAVVERMVTAGGAREKVARAMLREIGLVTRHWLGEFYLGEPLPPVYVQFAPQAFSGVLVGSR